MPEIDDNQLVKRVAQGDEGAFLTLYDWYVGRVHALTLRILGDPMLAEEATQDTFLKLWSRAHTYLAERGSLLTMVVDDCPSDRARPFAAGKAPSDAIRFKRPYRGFADHPEWR